MDRKIFNRNSILSGQSFLAPIDRINLGYMGTGEQGYTLLRGMGNLAKPLMVAASDVDSQKLAKFVAEAMKPNKQKSSYHVQG